ncbi:hypothetical protein ACWIG3_22590 [Streptomyces celluloflavus]
MCPESSVWATKARLEQTRGTEAANAAADRTVVRALRILPPGALPAPAPIRADAVPDGLGHRAGGGAAGSRAFAEPDVPPGRRAGPDRSGPHTAPPPDRGDRESQRPGREAPPGARCCPVGR